MNLDINEWKEFCFGKLITKIYKSKALNKDDLIEANDNANGIRYITRTAENNGCELIADVTNVQEEYIQDGNAISIGDTTATCFYQKERFITGDHMVVVRADWLNELLALYLVTILNNEQYKYSYGRAFLMDRIKETIIRLPIQHNSDGTPVTDEKHKYSDEGYVPDWQCMEDYIKSLHYKPLTTHNKVGQVLKLKVNEWREFKVGDFFDIHPTKFIDGVSADDCVGYGVPLVVNSAENNGIAGLCDLEPTEQGGIITFSDTTDGNTFFYQPRPFIGFAHVQGMYPKTRSWSEAELLFFSTLLMFDSRGKYSYGRKMRRDTISEIMIKLPVDINDEPDWKFMENYIKELPYGDRL